MHHAPRCRGSQLAKQQPVRAEVFRNGGICNRNHRPRPARRAPARRSAFWKCRGVTSRAFTRRAQRDCMRAPTPTDEYYAMSFAGSRIPGLRGPRPTAAVGLTQLSLEFQTGGLWRAVQDEPLREYRTSDGKSVFRLEPGQGYRVRITNGNASYRFYCLKIDGVSVSGPLVRGGVHGCAGARGRLVPVVMQGRPLAPRVQWR
jgi:hypothetical protein